MIITQEYGAQLWWEFHNPGKPWGRATESEKVEARKYAHAWADAEESGGSSPQEHRANIEAVARDLLYWLVEDFRDNPTDWAGLGSESHGLIANRMGSLLPPHRPSPEVAARALARLVKRGRP